MYNLCFGNNFSFCIGYKGIVYQVYVSYGSAENIHVAIRELRGRKVEGFTFYDDRHLCINHQRKLNFIYDRAKCLIENHRISISEYYR